MRAILQRLAIQRLAMDSRLVAVLVCALAMALLLMRLTAIPTLYFDEIHYVPAARQMLAGIGGVNMEHPLLGKWLISIGIMALGDNPWGWRLPAVLAGVITLFSLMRAVWWASLSRAAAAMAGLLLVTNQLWYVNARIAMLDAFMLAPLAVAFWMIAAACRHSGGNHVRLALAGVMLGLAMGAKWSAVPVCMAAGIGFAIARIAATGFIPGAWLAERDAAPVRGVSLPMAVLWLGFMPVAAYAVSFAPALFYSQQPLSIGGFIDYQRQMIALQAEHLPPHPYQSRWPQWLLNLRPIWYFYEPVDGIQRGVLLLGNPFTMLASLPALALCLWLGFASKRRDMLAVAGVFVAALGMWLVLPKAVQFYYHYLIAGCVGSIALALVLDELWLKDGKRWVPLAVCGLSAAVFLWFLPILSAAPLAGDQSFLRWMWLDSWR